MLIEAKKLQFNLTKCVNMHVGPGKEKCEDLQVHDIQMLTSEKQKYLGDIICSSGSNGENIKERCKTGHSAISQIKSMMKDISLGSFTAQIGLILRDSIFLSKMLLNSEVWHSLTKSQINDLETIDRVLMRQTLNAHSKTGIEWLYADTGKLNLKSHIQMRRLMYAWHILSRDESELIHRIYKTQKTENSVGDLVRILEADKMELGIDMTDAEIQGVSHDAFKTYVQKKVKINFLKYINNLKKSHSKSEKLHCTEVRMAEYLKTPKLNTRKKELLFKLRSKTFDVKQNFKNMNKDPWCISCGLFQETQGHLLQCPELVKNLHYLRGKTSKLEENYIYGTIEQQEIIVNIYSDILEVRENLQRELNQSKGT